MVAIIQSPATDVYKCQLMLYTTVLAEVWSGRAIPAAAAVSVPAVVVLARGLPGDSEPGGDLRPPDAQANRVVNQHCWFCFRLVPPSRVRSICSSTWAADRWLIRCAGPVGSAGACCCQPGRRCLTRGPDRRLDLPMESSMRPRYDNSGLRSLEGRQRAAGLTPEVCELRHIISGIAVAGGQ